MFLNLKKYNNKVAYTCISKRYQVDQTGVLLDLHYCQRIYMLLFLREPSP